MISSEQDCAAPPATCAEQLEPGKSDQSRAGRARADLVHQQCIAEFESESVRDDKPVPADLQPDTEQGGQLSLICHKHNFKLMRVADGHEKASWVCHQPCPQFLQAKHLLHETCSDMLCPSQAHRDARSSWHQSASEMSFAIHP